DVVRWRRGAAAAHGDPARRRPDHPQAIHQDLPGPAPRRTRGGTALPAAHARRARASGLPPPDGLRSRARDLLVQQHPRLDRPGHLLQRPYPRFAHRARGRILRHESPGHPLQSSRLRRGAGPARRRHRPLRRLRALPLPSRTPTSVIRFITPALNESPNLPRLFARLESTLATMGREGELILVDDGSTDDTVQVAESHRGRMAVRCVSHGTNRGPGAAFRTGFISARSLHRAGDLWCTLESDNTSDPAILSEMARRAEGGADLVLASVYAPGGKVLGTSRTRKVLSVWANTLMRSAFGLPHVHTFTSFYRVYRGDFMLKALDAWGD